MRHQISSLAVAMKTSFGVPGNHVPTYSHAAMRQVWSRIPQAEAAHLGEVSHRVEAGAARAISQQPRGLPPD